MSSSVFELFDEYAAAYARGERPSAEDYLDRAGAEREQLAVLLEELLGRAPVHSPSEDDVRHLGLMLAEEPPLLALRVERGLRVDDVVGALIEQLGLDEAKRAKVKRYYQRLEGGLLDPTRTQQAPSRDPQRCPGRPRRDGARLDGCAGSTCGGLHAPRRASPDRARCAGGRARRGRRDRPPVHRR